MALSSSRMLVRWEEQYVSRPGNSCLDTQLPLTLPTILPFGKWQRRRRERRGEFLSASGVCIVEDGAMMQPMAECEDCRRSKAYFQGLPGIGVRQDTKLLML